MGVTGLWKLIEPCGKPVPVETLEGKVLAIDISIWLHQVVKGFQDSKGAALNNAHLLGLFHRLCKLMYYRVKPVFVFDGCVPQLKRDTIARRQQQRNKLSSEADRIQNLLLQSLAKEKVVQMALGPNAELLLTSPGKKKIQNKDDSADDMFKLPELPESSKKAITNGNDSMDDSFEDSFYSNEDYTTTSASDSSHEESNPRNAYSSNLQAIDVKSKDFKQLPADVRHDILVDIKETRKQSSWGRLHELPSHSDDFSTFQMKRLLKRRQVQVSLEEAEKEMGNDHALTYSELTNIFTEEGILESETLEKGTKQISSSENTRYLLVRDLKKKLKNIEEEVTNSQQELESKLSSREDELPSTSKIINDSDKKIKKNDILGEEYDSDLELAIALSLQEETDKVYNEKDYDYDSDETIKLNKDQRKQLQYAAKGPAAAYMIEYAGMNKEEVDGIMDKTQVGDIELNDTLNIERLIGDIDRIEKTFKDVSKSKVSVSESQEICLRVSDDSDSTDSDLEEVEEENPKPVISVTVELDKVPPPEDDIFADVFKEDECVIQETPEFSDQKPIHFVLELDQKIITQKDDLFASGSKTEEIIQFKENQEDECVIQETPPVLKKEESKDSELKANVEDQNKSSSKNSEMLSILDDLKKQVNDIKNINLESIKLQSSVVEISDDESPPKEFNKDEIIEICDSDDSRRPSTPPICAQAQQSPKSSGKSPKYRTPSKNHSITEFFNVNYVVKRTPDKPLPDDDEKTVKIQSPFFIKKSPRSGSKSGSNSPPNSNKMSKASKTLFGQNNESLPTSNADAVSDGIEPLPIQETVTAEDVMKQAADLLKSHRTTDELSNLAANLAKDRRELEAERNRQGRMGMSITQRMNSDCQDLLRLFGVPFIVAPMEAEAQCAFLDIAQLTNGTITDDSDIWLFGGSTVYKNFFAQNKHVMEFRSEQIEKNFNCDRNKLIQLACLVGSDYTTGIHGIGAVTALEILASFTPKENNPESCNLSTIQNILSTLQRFRSWWQSMKTGASPPGSSARHALQRKLKNIEMLEGFPNIAVIEAYIAPKVDDNREAMSWGYPDVESLREFARKSFGWTSSKTDDILMPVIKKLNEKKTQQSIRNYFNVKSTLSSRQVKVSKRVKNAIDKMTGNVDSDDTPEKPKKAKRPRQPSKAVAKNNVKSNDPQTKVEDNLTVSLTIEAGSSSEVARGPVKRTSKRTNIPSAMEIIPQREKSMEQMEANKALAAAILRNTTKDVKRQRKA